MEITPWYKICGEEYIADIYQWAHEADSNAVLFYNVYDGRSWLNRGNRKAYPLLFDENLKPKKAYWEVVKF